MQSGIARNKSKSFALRIIKLSKYLMDVKQEYVLSKQILRSGTSIGANLAEAECAISKKRFSGQGLYSVERSLGNPILARIIKRFRIHNSHRI